GRNVPVTGRRSAAPEASYSPRAAPRNLSSRGSVNFSPEAGTSHSTTDESASTPTILSLRLPPPRLFVAPAASSRPGPGSWTHGRAVARARRADWPGGRQENAGRPAESASGCAARAGHTRVSARHLDTAPGRDTW